MTINDDMTHLQRKETSKQNLSYGDSIILHESNINRVVLVPFYITRSERTQLAIRLEEYRKTSPSCWNLLKEHTISLNEADARNLLHALQKLLAMAEHNSVGEYIAIRLIDGKTDFKDHKHVDIARALCTALSNRDIACHLTSKELGNELVMAFRSSIRQHELQSAVVTLRENLNSGLSDEKIYQLWCEKHSWAFGNAYVMRDEIRNIAKGDQIDLILPTVVTGFRDIIELKRPDMDVLLYDNSHRDYYFSQSVSVAIGQCHRYLDILHADASNGFRYNPEIVAYYPRATIVIGRSDGWDKSKLKALHGLNSRLKDITIMTYDQLLAQGERLIEIIQTDSDQDGEMLDESLSLCQDEDDIPF